MDALEVTERIRDACVEAAVVASEYPGRRGLCTESRWEATLGTLRILHVQALVREFGARSDTRPA